MRDTLHAMKTYGGLETESSIHSYYQQQTEVKLRTRSFDLHDHWPRAWSEENNLF
jgi:hypothetical protein